MAQAVNMVLADAQVTPVNHTFIPLGLINGRFWFEDQSGASPLVYNRISVSIKRGAPGQNGENQGDKVARMSVHVWTPTGETMGTNDAGIIPPLRLAYQLSSKHEFVMSERSTKVERSTNRKFAYLVLDQAQIKAMIDDLIPLW